MSTVPTDAYKSDHDLIEELLTAIRPEHLLFLKIAIPKELYAKVVARAALLKKTPGKVG